jgi:hypothetical protein
MIGKYFVGLFFAVAAFLIGLGQIVAAPQTPVKELAKKEPAKKEVPALAKEIVKMKVQRVFNEKVEFDRAEKTVEEKEKFGQLLALFPQVGTDKEPDALLPNDGRRLYGAAYAITLERENGESFYIVVSSSREFWCWAQGKAKSNGDWHLKNAKEVGKFLDELRK